jgi:hypothetical protein
VVRARGRHESATVFLPAVRPLLTLAAEMEEERNHVVTVPACAETDDLGVLEDVLEGMEGSTVDGYEALDAEAEFAHLLHGGRAVLAASTPLDAADEDFVGLPGLLSPEQTAALLARRDADVRKRVHAARTRGRESMPEPPPAQASWRQAGELRREVNRLVGVYAARYGGTHAQVHAEIRRAVPGPPSASATADVLESRRDHLMLLLSR